MIISIITPRTTIKRNLGLLPKFTYVLIWTLIVTLPYFSQRLFKRSPRQNIIYYLRTCEWKHKTYVHLRKFSFILKRICLVKNVLKPIKSNVTKFINVGGVKEVESHVTFVGTRADSNAYKVSIPSSCSHSHDKRDNIPPGKPCHDQQGPVMTWKRDLEKKTEAHKLVNSSCTSQHYL